METNNTPKTKKQIAYIFKSKRARRLMKGVCIWDVAIKRLVGKTFPVIEVNEVYVDIRESHDTTWAIPLDACNVIDVEEVEI